MLRSRLRSIFAKGNLANYVNVELMYVIASKIRCLPLACSFTFYVASGNMDSCLQRLKVRLQEWDWLNEEKNIKVSQSEAGRVHSFAKRGKKRYRWRDTDDSQIWRLRPPPPPPPKKKKFLQIYTIHVNDLFQGENGEFCRKVTSLHPWL